MKWLAFVCLLLSVASFGFAADGGVFDQVHLRPLPQRAHVDGYAPRPAAVVDPAAIAAALGAALRPFARPESAAALADKPQPSPFSADARRDGAILYGESGTPRQIRSEALQRPLHAAATAAVSSAIDAARACLRENAALLRVVDPDRELVITENVTDVSGRSYIRFDQQYNGVTVWPSELLVHVNPAGSVDLIEGDYVPTPRHVAPAPVIDARAAIARARGSARATASTSVPELIIFARPDRRPRLAWKMTVHESLTRRWVVVVDAMNGAILDRFNAIETGTVPGSGRDLQGTTRTVNVWQDGATYLMLDATKAMFDPSSGAPSPQATRGGIFIADATNLPATSDPTEMPSSLAIVTSTSPTSWAVPDSVSASYWISQTYDYYLDRHQRNSVDGNKGTIAGVVRLGKGYPNAFWDSEQQLMVFGDADTYAGSLDVIAHEMTHGVTSNTARLVYQDQSGALNEAISDIFGEMTEKRTYGSNDWILGSQLHTPARSMADPHRFGQPAKFSEFVHTTEDNGGVHTNSGIINYAYYMLAQGLSGAIGTRDSEKIFYRALTQHLTKSAQFIDARLAAITAAQEIFGSGSVQAQKTAEAFDAVEIFTSAPTPKDPAIPAVNGAEATVFLYKDTGKNAWFLARKEIASDGALGAALSRFGVFAARPAVSGDGSLAVFVDSVRDVCLIPTDGTQAETCLNLPTTSGIRVASVGMSPDAREFGFVLFGSDNNPENRIIVVDAQSGATRQYTVATPTYDGGSFSTVEYADTMTFTADGQFLVYDALNDVTTNGSAWQAWSIYALDLDSGRTMNVIDPIEGLDIGYPLLGHTSDDLITFEAYDPSTGVAGVIAANLGSGNLKIIGTQNGIESVPSFTGDDRAIVYTVGAANPTGGALVRQNLDVDHITPSGSPTSWIDSAAFGVMYRRGTYGGPTTTAGSIAFGSAAFNVLEGSTATISVTRLGGNKGAVSVAYATSNGSAVAGTDYQTATGTLTWADGEDGAKTFKVRSISDSVADGSETVTLSLSSATNGASIGTPSTATLTIGDVSTPAPAAPARKRSARH
jgi:Zn-dependent metalloprotease